MPNPRNIDAPVTLIANGRSGTSLIQSIFSHHPAFDCCGETAAMVFGVWHSTERLKGIVRPDRNLGATPDFELRCGKAVRAVMLDTFRAGNKRFWMHKPIGVPWVWQTLGKQGMSEAERVKWYWQVMAVSFPESQNITVLRHPYDVVISAVNYWNITPQQAWSSVVRMARILGHRDANITYAVNYSQLVKEPLAETERMFEAIGRPFNPLCLKAFESIWVPDMETRKAAYSAANPRVDDRFSRQKEWSQLAGEDFSEAERNTICSMWRRYGVELVLKSPCSL